MFDAAGKELAVNDDGSAAGESASTCESYLEYTFTVAGTYYLGVSAYGNQDYNVVSNVLVQSGGSTGNYRLAFGLVQAEDSDPDDTLATAVSISAGEKKQAALESQTDVDLYEITVSAGDVVNATVSLQGLQDSYLRLFDANGNQLVVNDDIGNSNIGRKKGKGSQITWQAVESGKYYIGVSGYGNVNYNPVTGGGDVGDGVKIYGGLGNDTIWANNGNNMLFGDAGNDRLVGGANNDVIVGGSGNDSMHGGGGEDLFCFGGNWGVDTIEQLAGGSVTLWFESGSEDNWNASTHTYTEGENSVKVNGIAANNITLIFGDNDSLLYNDLTVSGCFSDEASEKIFEDKNKGMLA